MSERPWFRSMVSVTLLVLLTVAPSSAQQTGKLSSGKLSFDAKATKVRVWIRMDVDGDVSVSVADDGSGMDIKALLNAMTYGAKSKKDKSCLRFFPSDVSASGKSSPAMAQVRKKKQFRNFERIGGVTTCTGCWAGRLA